MHVLFDLEYYFFINYTWRKMRNNKEKNQKSDGGYCKSFPSNVTFSSKNVTIDMFLKKHLCLDLYCCLSKYLEESLLIPFHNKDMKTIPFLGFYLLS